MVHKLEMKAFSDKLIQLPLYPMNDGYIAESILVEMVDGEGDILAKTTVRFTRVGDCV